MAEPVPFPESNRTYTAPPGHPEVLDLDTFVCEDGRVISKWRLTTKEIEEVQKTGIIWLHIWCGGRLPPQCITVESPFTPQKENPHG